MTPALSVRGLSKRFGRAEVVRGVDLEVARGEIVALLGPNGGGKTTILRCIAGLALPAAGEIAIDGRSARDPAARASVGLVPQQPLFPRHVSARELVTLHARMRGCSTDAVDGALARAGVASVVAEAPVHELSVGMRQRVALAVALVGAPLLLLLDEPTASLDPQAVLLFRRLVAQHRDAGGSALLATHVLADVEQLADRVIVVMDGRVALSETVQSLRRRLERHVVVGAGAPVASSLDRLYLDLVQEGVHVSN